MPNSRKKSKALMASHANPTSPKSLGSSTRASTRVMVIKDRTLTMAVDNPTQAALETTCLRKVMRPASCR